MGRNNADFQGIKVTYSGKDGDDHVVVAQHPTKGRVGFLRWSHDDHDESPYSKDIEQGEITHVEVGEEWRRRGIATQMFKVAKSTPAANPGKFIPEVKHSDELSEDGKAWAKAVERNG